VSQLAEMQIMRGVFGIKGFAFEYRYCVIFYQALIDIGDFVGFDAVGLADEAVQLQADFYRLVRVS
jgi:hypothetical protein